MKFEVLLQYAAVCGHLGIVRVNWLEPPGEVP
jgi:hypothetical protein